MAEPINTNPLLEDFAQIKAFGADPKATAVLNMAQDRGNTLATDNQILMDRATLSPFEFQMKYGNEVNAAVGQTDLAANTLRRMSLDTRTGDDRVIDNLSNAVIGFNSSLANIGILATRVVNKDAAIGAAGLLGDYRDWAQSRQSETAGNIRQLDAMRTELDSMDNAAQYEEDKSNDGELIATLKSFGRDAAGAVTRMIEDPRVAEAGITEGLGSVFAAGPVGKGLSVIGNALTKAAGMGVAATAASTTTPIAIGLMEGGGAYSGTIEEVMNTSHADLMKSSPEYQSLIMSGTAPEAAKRIIADKAAVTAASIQGPLGGLTGNLVSKFEAAPLAVNSIGSTVRNIATETLEEGIQSVTGEVAGNVGIRAFADENQNITEGAGSAGVQGAVFGAGSAGVIQAPGTALKTASDAIKGALTDASNAIITNGERINAANESASSVSEENIASGVQIAAETVPVVAESIRTLATEAKAPVEETEAFIQRVTNAVNITPEEIAALPANLQETIPDVTNRFQALAQMARVARDETETIDDRTSAAVFLLDQLTNQKQLFQEDVPAFLDNVSHDDADYQNFEQYRNILSVIENTPAIQQAMKWAQEDLVVSNDNEIITPQIANNAVGVSRHAPQNANPELNDRVLAQADRGDVELTPEARKIIQAASSLVRAGQAFEQQMIAQETQVDPDYVSEASDIVSANIADKDNGAGYQYSMETHVRRINDAAQRGDKKALKERMTDLALFARHMRNKAQALNESFSQGGVPVTYQQLGANHEWVKEANRKPVFAKPGSARSMALARHINAEANAVAQLANNMATLYPELGIKPVTIPAPNPGMLSSLVQEVNAKRDLGDNEVTNESVQQPLTETSSSEVVPTSENLSQPSVSEQVIQSADQENNDRWDNVLNGLVEDARNNPDNIEDGVISISINSDELEAALERSDYDFTFNEQKTKAFINLNEKVPTLDSTDFASREIDQIVEAITPEEIQSDIQEEAQIIEQKAVNNINEAYPELAEPKEKGNWFKRAFKFTKNASSRMVRMENPLSDLSNLLNSGSALVEFLGKDIQDYDFTGEHAQAYQSLLNMGEIARASMKKRLSKLFAQDKDKSGKSLMDRFLAGEEVNRYRRGLVLNILDKTPTSFRYNSQLIETGIIAGLHWVLNHSASEVELDRKDIAGLIGIPEAEVTAQDMIDFNRDISVDMAVQSIASTITKFWGVSPNRNVADTYAKGIPEAVAKEVLIGLEAAGLVELGTIGRNDKTFGRVITDNVSEETRSMLTAASRDGAANFLADVALIERERPSMSVGQPPAQIADKQLRSPLVDNTTQQKAAIKKAQSTPYNLNMPVFNFINALGEKAFLKLMGGVEFEKGKLNVNYERSLEGVNRTLINSFRNVARHVSEIQAYAEKNNLDPSEVASYFSFNMSKVGRLQMLGLSTPQADKYAREVLMPTKSVLNLSDPVGVDAKRFWMTVGQGLGLKTEKLTRDAVFAKASDMTLNGQYAAIVNQLQDWLASGNELSETIVDDIRAINPDITMHGIHSLISVAQYKNAIISGDLENYTHFNYLEADGKTNGPINSLALFATGLFNETWIKLVAKGGFFIGAKNKTLNSVQGTEAGVDLYETIANLFAEKQNGMINKLEDNPAAQKQFESLLRVMNTLNSDISFDGENITIKRGATKNPLTISIYGSGRDGIASKVANELLEVIYENISNVDSELLKGISADFNSLIKNRAALDKESGKVIFYENSKKRPEQSRAEFTLTPEEFNALKSNVRIFFVDQMSEAIDEGVLGNVSAATGAVQKSTQIQSIILTAMFHNELIARMADKKNDPDYRKGDSLSAQEMDQIYKDLMPYSPVINTKTQSFFVSGAEKANRFETVEVNGEKISYPEYFSRSLDDTLSTPAYVYGPTLAGVKAVPSIVIGTGDGQMIQNILAKYDVTGLPVFDGFNMPASQIDDSGKLVNQAVYDTWNENPLQSVAESFAEFLRNNPLDTFNDNNPMKDYLLKEMSKVISEERDPSETATLEEVKQYLSSIGSELNDLAATISLRQEVLKGFDLSIDQMASAEAPFTQEGASLEGLTPDQIAQRLNQKYKELEAGKTTNTEAIQIENNALTEAVNTFSVQSEGGARVASQANLEQMLDALSKGLSKIHKEMLTATLKALKDKNYKVVFGTSEQIADYEANYTPNSFSIGTDYYGKIDFSNKIIFVSNISPETLIHELIHASTYEKTISYYNADKTLTNEENDAFARIEGLMQEWLLQNYENENETVQDARRQAVATINGYLNKNDLPSALNEFMAWSLANQNIAEVMSRTKVKNPIFKVLADMYASIKRIIWGTKFAIPVNDSMFSNLRFNTRVILAAPTKGELLIREMKNTSLYQSASFGSSDYITDLRTKFANKILAFVNNSAPIERDTNNLKSQMALINSEEIAQSFIAHGFNMDMQKSSTFRVIQAALMVETDLNAASMTRIQEVYSHVMNKLTVESFMVNPESNDPSDRYQAQEKYNVLNGDYLTNEDEAGRSSLMPSFLALSLVDESFREILSKIDKPASAKEVEGGLDALLTNMANASMDALSVTMSGEGRNTKNAKAALDALTDNLLENVGDQRSFIEQQSASGIDAVDNFIKRHINNLSEKVIDKSNETLANSTNPIVSGSARLVRFAASVINESASEKIAEGMTQVLNQSDGWNTVRELLAEIRGRTADNASVFDMISKVRAVVQQTRQQFREKLPEQIQNKFTRKLTDNDWTSLFNGLGKTDLGALYGSLGIDGAISVINDPKKLSAEIAKLEILIAAKDPIRFNLIQDKAKQLANFMNTGVHGVNLLRNAYAVAHLYGDKRNQKTDGSAEAIVDQLDQLITLYAVQGLNLDTKTTVAELINTEKEGVKFALSYLVGERNDELVKVTNNKIRVNHYKGNIPSENQLGTSLIVAYDGEHARLKSLGYIRLGGYAGSSADFNGLAKSYYFAPVSGRATYNQGVLQTVHTTVSGIDPRTGYSMETTAGIISDPETVLKVSKRIALQRTTDENLLPVFDDAGNIIAYERGIDPNKLTHLNRNTNLAQMIGAWRGRQMEEMLAKEFNNSLVDNLHDIWKDAKKSRTTNEFINLGKSTDPIHQDTWKLIPQDIKDYIKGTFGNEGFRIRRDMLNDAVGFRSASVGDLWTGNTRLNPIVQKKIQTALTGIFGSVGKGNETFSYLVNSEKFVQNVVTNAKILIVIKSVIVPAANLASNIFQLMNRGVPVRNVLNSIGSKTTELNDYIKRRDREITLDAELLAAKGANNNVQIRKIENELRSIRDSYKRMSIYPLIEAGEFSAITDGGITQEDLALANGKWANWAETLANKVPEGLKTPYRYAMITKDTALFQGLTRSVQYGDFIAKAILYDDLTKRKNKSSEDALADIGEEFINYNRLAGRNRNYAESVGLLWFWHFKLRAMKTANSLIRNHPFRTLMLANFTPALPIIGSIGSPVTDNFATILADGKLGYSMGPGMGLNSIQLNPWLNIIK